MQRRRCLLFGCSLLFAHWLPGSARAGEVHTFDADSEGWLTVSSPFYGHLPSIATAPLPFDGINGQPPGSVRIGDAFPETAITAPADHLGDQAAIYGDTLRYDILIRFSDNTAYPAVMLNGGTKSLYYEVPPPPVGMWQSRAVPLTETGWKVSNAFVPATQSDFIEVLSNLAGVYITTEWHTGADDTNVDNISLPIASPTHVGGTPAASGLTFLPAFPNPSSGPAGIALTLRHPGRVTVAVFDVRGQRVRTVATERFVADTATFTWDGKTETGDEAPSGIYFARVVTASGERATRKFVRIR